LGNSKEKKKQVSALEQTKIPLQSKLETALEKENAFDFKIRPLTVGGKMAFCTYIIGYTDSYLLERIHASLLALSPESVNENPSMQSFMERCLSLPSSEVTGDVNTASEEVLRGSAALVLEGFDEILLMDVRAFSTRGIKEPEKDRTLRGPHVGLNESLISNTVQIRRYLRTETLVSERFLVGNKIKSEVVVLSIKGRGDAELLKRIRTKLENASLPSLSMTQETLANLLFPQKGFFRINPFPRVRYTERPDVVAATLMEGKIAILCDNSPSVMLLPVTVFDFFEETDDYYFPPLTASYLRIVRIFIFLCSIFLIPIWLIIAKNDISIPDSFRFILADEEFSVPLYLQFLIIELAIDGLKMASLNTPNTLSGSFSVIGGLLLGEFAVKSGWFVPQTILYSAFCSIANFVPSNYELGYAFKFMRISLILLVEPFGVWGLVIGCIFWLILLLSTRSVAGKHYLSPVFPFDKTGFAKIFIRTAKGKERDF